MRTENSTLGHSMQLYKVFMVQGDQAEWGEWGLKSSPSADC